MDMSFRKLCAADYNQLLSWFEKEHIRLYWNGKGLENTLEDIDSFISVEKVSDAKFTHWLACEKEQAFAYLLSSDITEDDELIKKYLGKGDKAITLDLLIGEESYLGKGYGSLLIQQFLSKNFPLYKVFIDPECANERAIHVYKKAGFQALETFIPSWNPRKHLLMCREAR
ncbi:MAG: acetyltransferase [Chlamydiales bacterium]|nr:acetyltransferase [Chlamydiales bacterium]